MAQQGYHQEDDHFLQPPDDGRVYLREPEGASQPASGRSKLNLTAGSQSSVLPLIDTRGSLQSRRNAVSIGIFITALYSTLLSGLFVVVAILQPRYGFIISKRGSFSPSSATLLVTFMAKTIELSFVMVFLAFLGQTLSRKAIRQQGISLANVTMRSWIL